MEQPARFLLIDDDPVQTTICKITLKQAGIGAEIVAFTLPEKALEYIAAEYAANQVQTTIFLDINMPLLSGWDVLERFGKFTPAVKANFSIYMLSSSIDPSDRLRSELYPEVHGYIEKPISKKNIMALFPKEEEGNNAIAPLQAP
jgi:CheY-like chemotaxis protein